MILYLFERIPSIFEYYFLVCKIICSIFTICFVLCEIYNLLTAFLVLLASNILLPSSFNTPMLSLLRSSVLTLVRSMIYIKSPWKCPNDVTILFISDRWTILIRYPVTFWLNKTIISPSSSNNFIVLQMCKEEDMADFPRRMRDWLFNIMRDLADRQELPTHFLKMQREAETNLTLRWTNAAIWKWCDLDGHPHDRTVSRHELFPIRAPLMALEHCIAPFLDSCDINDDHNISLLEWGKCLQLEKVTSLFTCKRDKIIFR